MIKYSTRKFQYIKDQKIFYSSVGKLGIEEFDSFSDTITLVSEKTGNYRVFDLQEATGVGCRYEDHCHSIRIIIYENEYDLENVNKKEVYRGI